MVKGRAVLINWRGDTPFLFPKNPSLTVKKLLYPDSPKSCTFILNIHVFVASTDESSVPGAHALAHAHMYILGILVMILA